jgi:hypothetical protein
MFTTYLVYVEMNIFNAGWSAAQWKRAAAGRTARQRPVSGPENVHLNIN